METATRKPNRMSAHANPTRRTEICYNKDRHSSLSKYKVSNRERTRKEQTIARRLEREAKLAGR